MRFFCLLVCVICSGCLPAGLEGKAEREADAMNGTLLDVGQGLSVWFATGDGSLLYDTGPDSAGLLDTLLNRGIAHVGTVVVSHWHRDHAGGFADLAVGVAQGRFQVDRVLYGGDTAGAFWRDSVLGLCARWSIPVRKIERGDTLGDLAPFKVRVLWPGLGELLGENAASVALRVSDDERGWLLTGDLEQGQELELLKLEPGLRAEVWQVGHHGSYTASGWDFVTALRPDWALVGVGKGNDFGHPHREALARLYRVLPDSSGLLRTDRDGAVTLEWRYGIGVWRVH